MASFKEEIMKILREESRENDIKKMNSGNCTITGELKGNKHFSIDIPQGVSNIEDDAFSQLDQLMTIHLPKGIKSIGKYAFGGCTSLVTVSLPNSVTIIGEQAFQGCTSLMTIDLPKGLTSIGNFAFRACIRLRNIYVPNTVKYIGRDSFIFCPSLIIFCEVNSLPKTWDCDWNIQNLPVIWNHKNI